MNLKPHAFLAIVIAANAGCINIGAGDGSFALPDYDAGYPDALQNDEEVLSLANPDGFTNQEAVAANPDEEMLQPYLVRRYRLGPPNLGSGELGGLTLTIEGADIDGDGESDPVCIAVDPENTRQDGCDYNDGDVDMFAGYAEDYTGVLGESIGEFASIWVDDLGIEHSTDNNLCAFGSPPTSPAARSVPESCAFDTELGQKYTVLLKTFTVPVDDNVLNLAVLVQPGHRGDALCVFPSSSRYFVSDTAENLDESDAAFGDNPYAEFRDPCYCPRNAAEREECGLE